MLHSTTNNNTPRPQAHLQTASTVDNRTLSATRPSLHSTPRQLCHSETERFGNHVPSNTWARHCSPAKRNPPSLRPRFRHDVPPRVPGAAILHGHQVETGACDQLRPETQIGHTEKSSARKLAIVASSLPAWLESWRRRIAVRKVTNTARADKHRCRVCSSNVGGDSPDGGGGGHRIAHAVTGAS